MNYNVIKKIVENSKVAKFLGWFFLIASILVFFTTVGSYLGWKSKESGYMKEYVYSDSGLLVYELNEERIAVEKVFNTNGELIDLAIPNKKTAIMYCSKNNPSECIYFDANNSIDQNMLNPTMGIIVTLFLAASARFLIPKKHFNKKLKKDVEKDEYVVETTLKSIHLFFVFLFVVGIVFTIWQVYNAVNYFNLKNNNYVTVATIYSEIYNVGAKKGLYKSVSYYYVDNHKYVYVSDQYEEDNLSDNLGQTFELYYNKNNPSKVSKKKNPINLVVLIIGISFVSVTFPFVFFQKKMSKKIDDNILKQKNEKWHL